MTLASWASLLVPPRHWAGLAWGNGTSVAAGLLIGAVAWGLSLCTAALWRSLASSTFWIVRGLLVLAGQDVISDPGELLLGTATFAVRIAPECSGYEGIGLIWILLGAISGSSAATCGFRGPWSFCRSGPP